MNPDMLLVPPSLEETAKKIAGTAPVVWDYLAEPNNWFMVDDSKMRMWSGARAAGKSTAQKLYYSDAYAGADWRFAYGSSVEFTDDRTELEKIVDEEVRRLC